MTRNDLSVYLKTFSYGQPQLLVGGTTTKLVLWHWSIDSESEIKYILMLVQCALSHLFINSIVNERDDREIYF